MFNDMVEIWSDIEGYENLYQVSNLGRVKALGNGICNSKEKILKATKHSCGYLRICLHKYGKAKYYFTHRLVALAFLPNPYNLPQVNHKDEDKTNNRVDNLDWCSADYNMNYGTRNIRSAESNTNHPKKSKKVLCIETGKIYPSTHQVERELGFNYSTISKVCNGKYKTAYGFHWRYID